MACGDIALAEDDHHPVLRLPSWDACNDFVADSVASPRGRMVMRLLRMLYDFAQGGDARHTIVWGPPYSGRRKLWYAVQYMTACRMWDLPCFRFLLPWLQRESGSPVRHPLNKPCRGDACESRLPHEQHTIMLTVRIIDFDDPGMAREVLGEVLATLHGTAVQREDTMFCVPLLKDRPYLEEAGGHTFPPASVEEVLAYLDEHPEKRLLLALQCLRRGLNAEVLHTYFLQGLGAHPRVMLVASASSASAWHILHGGGLPCREGGRQPFDWLLLPPLTTVQGLAAAKALSGSAPRPQQGTPFALAARVPLDGHVGGCDAAAEAVLAPVGLSRSNGAPATWKQGVRWVAGLSPQARALTVFGLKAWHGLTSGYVMHAAVYRLGQCGTEEAWRAAGEALERRILEELVAEHGIKALLQQPLLGFCTPVPRQATGWTAVEDLLPLLAEGYAWLDRDRDTVQFVYFQRYWAALAHHCPACDLAKAVPEHPPSSC